MKEEFLELLNQHCGGNRSQWVRDACAEKLERQSVSVPNGFKEAPSRVGKGGRPRKVTRSVTVSGEGLARAAEEATGYNIEKGKVQRVVRKDDDESESSKEAG